ncbi:SMI1/KNR4 family protein [Aliikangiella maris]|uniref:SMI1/KNR4 family protein n=2 Tax=Aliikangiella maris TaxID=3162458 RepID=A0ABV3MV84_9GAMM
MKLISYEKPYEKVDYIEVVNNYFKESNMKLPESFLEFLVCNGTGEGPHPGSYLNEFQIRRFYSFSDDCSQNVFHINEMLKEDGRISRNVFAFAVDMSGHGVFCLVLDGVLEGQVLLMDDDNILLKQDYSESDVSDDLFLDISFESFLNNLVDEE